MNKTAKSLPIADTAPDTEYVPLANLRSTVATAEAQALVKQLANRYPRKSFTQTGHYRIRHYRRIKTRAAYEIATAAFLAELLLACSDDRRDRWLSCSLDRNRFIAQQVSFRMFDHVRKSWTAAGLVRFKKHQPGRIGSDYFGRFYERPTRYRATPKLLRICSEQGVTPRNVRSHFQFESKTTADRPLKT